jgi:trans-2,3-dihydro-3-hydroxyanthranilate isomerase
MPALQFRILNVFTANADRLSGNPLCVFENGESLDTRTMQRLARQFNLSETTFLLPSSRATAQVRIFTPGYEMSFAGHPTLGSAFVCRSMGLCANEATLEMQAGVIPVRAQQDRWTLQANAPTTRPCETSAQVLAEMLGIEASDVGGPPLWVKAGKEQLIVPLRSEAAVRSVRPNAARFSAVRSEDGHSMAYVFAQLAPDRVLGRFFFPQDAAILEDPATGSATANLGGWYLATRHSLPLFVQIDQGEYAGRPSRLFLNVDSQQHILVGGEVLELGRGSINL